MSEINEMEVLDVSTKHDTPEIYNFNEKKEFKIFLTVTSLVCTMMLFLCALFLLIIPSIKYSTAIKLMDAGEFTKATKTLVSIEGFRDSEAVLYECKYKNALSKIKEESYTEAISLLSELGQYKDSQELLSASIANNSLKLVYENAVSLMNAGEYKAAIDEFEVIGQYKDSKDKIKECRYNNALALENDYKYFEATNEFKALADYKDSAARMNECIEGIHKDARYNNAIDLMNTRAFSDAIIAFEELGNYRDSSANITECKYGSAVDLMSKDTIGAYKALLAMGDYKDSVSKAAEIHDDYQNLLNIKNSKVGDHITFGSYEQDNDTSNGKEPIEWLVLDKNGNKTLVISLYALDCKPYNTYDAEAIWQTCTLRSWLNDTFFKTAFETQERSVIATTKVVNPHLEWWGANVGKNTNDKVFLLSIDEAYDYFNSPSARACMPTNYAVKNGAWSNYNVFWWLRSYGHSGIGVAASVDNFGYVETGGMYVVSSAVAVRPAMWISIND